MSKGRPVETDAEEGGQRGYLWQVVQVADVLAGRIDAYQRDVDQAWGL